MIRPLFASIVAAFAALSAAQTFTNAGFETPAHPSGYWDYTLAGTDWSFGGWVGLASGRGAWGQAAHTGNQYGFIQSQGGGGGFIEQTVTGFVPGNRYQISFWMASRLSGFGADYPNNIRVFLDGTTEIFSNGPTGEGTWRNFVTQAFVATTDTYTIRFAGDAGPDRASLLDDITVINAPPLSVGQFANSSFEAPAIGDGQFLSNPGTGDTFWTGTGYWGVARLKSAWGRKGIGSPQYGFIAPGGSISQTITGLIVGKVYSVSFYVQRRTGNVGGTTALPFQVLLNDTATILPTTSPGDDGLWHRLDSDQFLATQDTYTFTWRGWGVSGAVLLDHVDLGSVPKARQYASVIGNSGFETPVLSADTYVDAPTSAGTEWTGFNWGIANGNTTWGTGGHSSNQYAFIRSSSTGPGEMTQTFNDLMVGRTYKISFYLCKRAGTGAASKYPNLITVSLEDGTEILVNAKAPGTGAWVTKTTATFVAKARKLTVTFSGQIASASRPDLTSLIDDVKITKVGS